MKNMRKKLNDVADFIDEQTVRTYQQQNTKKQQLASILNSTKLQKAGGKPGFHHPCATSCKVSFGGANMERMELACGLAKFRMKEYSEVM